MLDLFSSQMQAVTIPWQVSEQHAQSQSNRTAGSWNQSLLDRKSDGWMRLHAKRNFSAKLDTVGQLPYYGGGQTVKKEGPQTIHEYASDS